MVMTLAACHRVPRTPSLHYLPGFVAGSENIFEPTAIGVTNNTGDDATDKIVAGGVYEPDGKLLQPVVVKRIEPTVTVGLERALADSGLKPILVKMDGNQAPSGAAFILNSRLVAAQVLKQFGVEQTVHGQYFTMDATVTIAYELRNRTGEIVLKKQIVGAEHEPPKPVGHEVFFPLETEPVEALSVAMSRAIGGLIVDPEFRNLMPARPRAAIQSSPAP